MLSTIFKFLCNGSERNYEYIKVRMYHFLKIYQNGIILFILLDILLSHPT